jgi:hypothetical protein
MQGIPWFKSQNLGLKSQKLEQQVLVGSTFRHRIPGNSIEIATVVGVETDYMGIPHVTYNVRVEKASSASYWDQRTLALSSFCDHFEEAISA